jgi:hypothetical protein
LVGNNQRSAPYWKGQAAAELPPHYIFRSLLFWNTRIGHVVDGEPFAVARSR